MSQGSASEGDRLNDNKSGLNRSDTRAGCVRRGRRWIVDPCANNNHSDGDGDECGAGRGQCSAGSRCQCLIRTFYRKV